MEVDLSEGVRVYTFATPEPIEVYAFEGGTIAVHHSVKNQSVSIDPIGMTEDEVERSVSLASTLLERAAVNRAQRRAAR